MTDPHYVARRAAQWVSHTRYTWAVCEPTTGELLAEVTLDPGAATVHTRARAGHADAAAESSVRRFASAALGITVT